MTTTVPVLLLIPYFEYYSGSLPNPESRLFEYFPYRDFPESPKGYLNGTQPYFTLVNELDRLFLLFVPAFSQLSLPKNFTDNSSIWPYLPQSQRATAWHSGCNN
jgi:hypothetical protein